MSGPSFSSKPTPDMSGGSHKHNLPSADTESYADLRALDVLDIRVQQPDVRYATTIQALFERAFSLVERAVDERFLLNNLDIVVMRGLPHHTHDQSNNPSMMGVQCIDLRGHKQLCLLDVRVFETLEGPKARVTGYVSPEHPRDFIEGMVADVQKGLGAQTISPHQEGRFQERKINLVQGSSLLLQPI